MDLPLPLTVGIFLEESSYPCLFNVLQTDKMGETQTIFIKRKPGSPSTELGVWKTARLTLMRTSLLSRGTSLKSASCANGISTSGSEMAVVLGMFSNSWVRSVEPHLPLLDNKTRVPWGSPTSSASLTKKSCNRACNGESPKSGEITRKYSPTVSWPASCKSWTGWCTWRVLEQEIKFA